MKNHKQLSITILSLCIVIGAIVFSEFTPATLFEFNSLQEASNKDLSSISGTSDKCSCSSDKACEDDDTYNKKCIWDLSYGDGVCMSCPEGNLVNAKVGSYVECLNDGKEDTWGCCSDRCVEIGTEQGRVCPKSCVQVSRNVNECKGTTERICTSAGCYK